MITEVHVKVFAEKLANGDIENAYVFNVYKGKVSLMADMEDIGLDIESNIETMNFEIPDSFYEKTVDSAAYDVRGIYAGGIEIEPYADEMEAISRLPDGIVYVYIS